MILGGALAEKRNDKTKRTKLFQSANKNQHGHLHSI